MPAVRIYQPRKNAMQSGRGKTKIWMVEFEPGQKPASDKLMGWVGQGDTRNQLKMRFGSSDDAVAFCVRNELDYQIVEPKKRRLHRKSYSDNFSPDREKNWTH
jgi:hypothetical protein